MFDETVGNTIDPVAHEVQEDTIDPALVREELRRIVSSRHFQTSKRGKEFLQYVVNQKISGHGDLLKERLIGVQIFGRKPDYSTGEDPVVRVQAGDVRRRLEQYHADTDFQSKILIQIPLGSYAPVFCLRRDRPARKTSTEMTESVTEGVDSSKVIFRSPENVHESVVESAEHQTGLPAEAVATPDLKPGSGRRTTLKLMVIPFVACLTLIGYLATSYLRKLPEPAMKAFWLPASLSSKPVLLCLPKPMVYRPSDKLFDRYRATHPNAFETRESRQDQILPLELTDTIQWGDMVPSRNAGPGIGGVIAAINMSKLLTEQGIRYELRFGDEARYTEMRDSPVVIIGAINTDWATQLTSESNFVFDETLGAPNIHETGGAKRIWKMESSNGRITRDYGLITRQVSGKSGQFLVQVAGISHFGTEAASEMLVQQQELAKVLRSESISLQKKNLQIVVSTDVTDERAGPPHVVAVTSW